MRSEVRLVRLTDSETPIDQIKLWANNNAISNEHDLLILTHSNVPSDEHAVALVRRSNRVEVLLYEDHDRPDIIALRLPHARRQEIDSALSRHVNSSQQPAEGEGVTLENLVAVMSSSGVAVHGVDAHPWTPTYSGEPQALRWKRASRGGDGLFSTIALRPVSRQVSRGAVRFGVSPNALTIASLLLALSAAALLATGKTTATITAAVLMYMSMVLDCSDGEVARFTGKSSPMGGWLDGFTDRIKEHSILAGLAFAAHAAGYNGWLVGGIAVGVITARHMSNFAFVDKVLANERANFNRTTKEFKTRALANATTWRQRPGLRETSVRGWVSRVLHAPVSERWLILGAVPLVFDAHWALIAYSAYVTLSLCLTLAGWLIRTKRLSASMPEKLIRELKAIGDVRGMNRAMRLKWSWLVAPITAAIEVAPLVLITAAANGHVREGSGLAAFLVIVVSSWLRYERAYGVEYGGAQRIAKLGGDAIVRAGLWVVTYVLVLVDLHEVAYWVLLAATTWLLLIVVAAAASTYKQLRAVTPLESLAVEGNRI